jgi:hypothetical protein
MKFIKKHYFSLSAIIFLLSMMLFLNVRTRSLKNALDFGMRSMKYFETSILPSGPMPDHQVCKNFVDRTISRSRLEEELNHVESNGTKSYLNAYSQIMMNIENILRLDSCVLANDYIAYAVNDTTFANCLEVKFHDCAYNWKLITEDNEIIGIRKVLLKSDFENSSFFKKKFYFVNMITRDKMRIYIQEDMNEVGCEILALLGDKFD